jgi:trehalose/maltose hydrolase-like predicted phosphorylase
MVNITVAGDSDNWVPLSRRDGTNFSWVSQNASTIAQSWMLDLTEGQTVTILKYVGIVSSEDYPDALNTATETAREAALISWDVLIKEHIDAWEAAWDGTDIVVPSNENLTVLARSSLFHLLASLRPDKENLGGHSIMVGGLASDSYAGLIFWDAETWMYPALLVLRPEYADNINKYRLRLLDQAVSNAQLYNYSGALYPWTSARYGNCTGTGLCQHYQYHLNIDIALAHWQYYLQTKSKAWLAKSGWPVIREVADMFAAFVRKNTSRHGQYETIRMGEPVYCFIDQSLKIN